MDPKFFQHAEQPGKKCVHCGAKLPPWDLATHYCDTCQDLQYELNKGTPGMDGKPRDPSICPVCEVAWTKFHPGCKPIRDVLVESRQRALTRLENPEEFMRIVRDHQKFWQGTGIARMGYDDRGNAVCPACRRGMVLAPRPRKAPIWTCPKCGIQFEEGGG